MAPLGSSGYSRRRPENTVLYQLVVDHLETMLEQARLNTAHGFGLPRFVERAFYHYVECGQLCCGFVRTRCQDCGFERLVAFSCKRAICPSCQGRRMADSAAHLVDRVLPRVPYRQWVISFPIRLRLLLARDKALLSAVLRIVIARIFAWQRRVARSMGVAGSQGAAVALIQRFGSAINLNIHFHVVVADGVFVSSDDGQVQLPLATLALACGSRFGRSRACGTRAEFVPTLAPSDDDVERILQQVMRRIDRLLSRREDDAVDSGDDDDQALAQLCFESATSTRRIARRDDDWEHPVKRKRRCCFIDGFSLHADVTTAADDRAGLERLCRYGLRPPIALARLSVDDEGRVHYRLERPFGAQTELVLEPVEFIRRLALLLPPPRQHQLRYLLYWSRRRAPQQASLPPPGRGALAPNSRLRKALLPQHDDDDDDDRTDSVAAATLGVPPPSNALPATIAAPVDEPATSQLASTPLPVGFIGRIDEPAAVRDRYVDWATLIKRVFDEDVTTDRDTRSGVASAAAQGTAAFASVVIWAVSSADPRCRWRARAADRRPLHR
jgi:Putative transposase/Transposase zinc-binding domain